MLGSPQRPLVTNRAGASGESESATLLPSDSRGGAPEMLSIDISGRDASASSRSTLPRPPPFRKPDEEDAPYSALHNSITLSGPPARALHRYLHLPNRFFGPFLLGAGVLILLLAFILGVLVPGGGASSASSGPLDLHLLVIGDWGRQGNYNQSETADRMASVARAMRPAPAAVISTGDNFYGDSKAMGGGGLFSPEDPNFVKSFKSIYSKPGLLGIPWYAVLGNHDYADPSTELTSCTVANGSCTAQCCFSALHQLDSQPQVRLRLLDSRWHCERNFRRSFGPRGEVDVFFLDTTPLVESYYSNSWASQPGGPSKQAADSSLLELESALHSSTARWKIVVGHHPVWSNGAHESTPELVERVNPLLIKYKVDMWLNGHDHMQEMIVKDGIYYATSGAGSQTRKGFNTKVPALYQSDVSGFLALKITEKSAVFSFYVYNKAVPDKVVTLNKA